MCVCVCVVYSERHWKMLCHVSVNNLHVLRSVVDAVCLHDMITIFTWDPHASNSLHHFKHAFYSLNGSHSLDINKPR